MIKSIIPPTQADVKRLFDYDPLTGIMVWRAEAIKQKCLKGMEAGTVHHTGCRMVRISGAIYLTHRIIWLWVTGAWPVDQIDHLNHVRDDNRWANIREATSTVNGRNRSINCDNTSGATGVNWEKCANKWRARIRVNYKKISLGTFTNKKDAIAAREAANVKYGFHENHGK